MTASHRVRNEPVSKLLERLSDPKKSGVYRVSSDLDIRDALAGTRHDLAAVPLGAGKAAMMADIAKALGFPGWFGGNWDALEDCLTDLSWRGKEARIFVFTGAAPGDEFGILRDVLASAAEHWAGRGEAFFAVFVDPAGELGLPLLYKEKVRGTGH